METHTWPVLPKSSKNTFQDLRVSSIKDDLRAPDVDILARFLPTCNISFERSPTITSFKKDLQWTTSSEFISNEINLESGIFEQGVHLIGEGLAGMCLDDFKDKPEELVIRILSWDKPFLVHLNVADAPRYLEIIRSEIRHWFRYQYFKSPWRKERVFKLEIDLPFILVSDKSQTIGGTCTNANRFPLRLSRRLAMELAEFPKVEIPASLANGQATNPTKRKVIVHFVRHAQSEQNIWGTDDWGACLLPDPALSPVGRAQCETLSKTFPHLTQVSQIFSSPAHRTLQTTQLSFPAILQRGIEVTPWPEIREIGKGLHNTGSEIDDLRARFQTMEVRWKEIIGQWPPGETPHNKSKFFIPLFQSVLERLFKSGQEAPAAKISTDDKNVVEILIVSSGGFLDRLENHFEKTHVDSRRSWRNTEFKSYELREREWVDMYGIQQKFVLLETVQSRVCGDKSEVIRKRMLEDAST